MEGILLSKGRRDQEPNVVADGPEIVHCGLWNMFCAVDWFFWRASGLGASWNPLDAPSSNPRPPTLSTGYTLRTAGRTPSLPASTPNFPAGASRCHVSRRL
jgi:hypothetical protein